MVDRKRRERTIIVWLIVVALFVATLGVFPIVRSGNVAAVSWALLVVATALFYARFERRSVPAREMALLAALAAIAAVGRIPFAALPSVQPTTFVVVTAGIAFGAEAGFVVGAAAAVVSNLFLGQGFWTPWQMFAWGLAGATAGWLRRTGLFTGRFGMAAFGFAWGFLFGWLMNLYVAAEMWDVGGPKGLVALAAASFWFDLAHAATNAVLLGLFGRGWVRTLDRIGRKYKIVSD
ncbi:MAG: hypothetical protein BLM47_05725 [Candidatus Reconcilbacillus cellulovorans]|uniref:ECF transporter S component n=1 Tax=Candidatus Reconcilbacillus cellulovorans TaxID=1906605 RepID=A0A2A6E1M0_9BACL|nr:MAG: hypothetical protein BLM47_05725 [Candidatus Reconcilbacillus cellulovorans]